MRRLCLSRWCASQPVRVSPALQLRSTRRGANTVAAAAPHSRALSSSTTVHEGDDDLRHAAIAGGGIGGRNPGLRSRTPGMGGRFTGATEGPAARRRTRPTGRTGLDFRISDGSILSAATTATSSSAAATDVWAPSGGGGALLGSAAQIPAGAAVARVSVASCKAGRLEDVVRYYELRIGPAYCMCEGFKAACLLVDRSSNTVRSLSFWASSEALLTSIEDEHYQKVARGLLQLVDPNSMSAETFEVGAQVIGKGGWGQ